MNELLAQICTYVIIQGSANVCNKTLSTAYSADIAVHDPLEAQRKQLEQKGLEIYQSIPYNTEMVGGYAMYTLVMKQPFSVNLGNHMDASYGGNTYKCTLHWGWD